MFLCFIIMFRCFIMMFLCFIIMFLSFQIPCLYIVVNRYFLFFFGIFLCLLLFLFSMLSFVLPLFLFSGLFLVLYFLWGFSFIPFPFIILKVEIFFLMVLHALVILINNLAVIMLAFSGVFSFPGIGFLWFLLFLLLVLLRSFCRRSNFVLVHGQKFVAFIEVG